MHSLQACRLIVIMVITITIEVVACRKRVENKNESFFPKKNQQAYGQMIILPFSYKYMITLQKANLFVSF